MSDAVRTALVTGANRGLGLEIARRLAAAGLRVWLGASNPALGEAAAATLRDAGGDVRFVHVDLLDLAVITKAADMIGEHGDTLDVLVNNAGIVSKGDGPPGKADLAAVRRAIETNFFGTLAVTQAMLPLLRRSTSGMIVNKSSSIGSLTLQADPDWVYTQVKPIGYASAKASLNMLTIQLAAELRDQGITVKPMPGAPKVYRYVQLQPIPETVPALQTALYDGVAEIWFDNLEDAAAMFTSDHYNTVVAKDEENFLDRSKTTFLYANEKVIL